MYPPGRQSLELQRFYRSVAELNQVMNRGVELTVLLDTIVRETTELLRAETTAVLLLDENRRLLCSSAHGLLESGSIHFQFGEGVAGWVVENGVPAVISDCEVDPRFVPFAHQTQVIRSLIAIPLVIRCQAIGVICATHSERGWFGKEDEQLLSFLANSVVLDVENARLYRMAITDGLTGLYNRQHLSQRLKEEVERSARYELPLTALMIDVDHFKAINDRYGHPTGDRVLRRLAELLTRTLRDVDVLARYGGEEFVAVLPNTDRAGGEQAARRLIESTRTTPLELDPVPSGERLRLTISVGGAVLLPDEEPRELLGRADAALYQAKRQGRDRFVFNWLGFSGRS